MWEKELEKNSLIAWDSLNFHAREIFREVYLKWSNLLDDKTKNEHDYLKYLNEYAGFFFHNEYPPSLITISELQLGSSYRPDFTRCLDLSSVGFKQEFIEIESPHDKVFTKKGNPSAQLTEAITQIEHWRIWIDDNREIVKRLFPSILFRSKGKPTISFTIIIGRRNELKEFTHLRNSYAERLNIDIRSFDYLTDLLAHRRFQNVFPTYSAQASLLTLEERNQLVNPFVTAYSSKTWNNIVEAVDFKDHHIFALNASILLENHKLNSLHERFVELYRNLDHNTKKFYMERIF